ncbi:FAD binding domain-containing protein, partial [Anaerocolumna sp.]|uniref:FAD binding domain-containing protein n=1 Tax=Anaerocolumna sp. TaxID=2041569 RepID=UPI0028AE2BCD
MVKSYFATSLKEALEIRGRESVTPYAGGTDLMIEADDNASYLFLNKIPELKQITVDDEYLRIGAASTFTEVYKSTLVPQILKDAVIEVAAPAIRNLGTVGGNICNGSPKGDSVLIFFATDSKLRLASSKGERILPIKDFY